MNIMKEKIIILSCRKSFCYYSESLSSVKHIHKYHLCSSATPYGFISTKHQRKLLLGQMKNLPKVYSWSVVEPRLIPKVDSSPGLILPHKQFMLRAKKGELSRNRLSSSFEQMSIFGKMQTLSEPH